MKPPLSSVLGGTDKCWDPTPHNGAVHDASERTPKTDNATFAGGQLHLHRGRSRGVERSPFGGPYERFKP
jgi:hypothetical protein